MKRVLTLASIVLAGFSMVSCQTQLKSESGLYKVELKKSSKVLVDGVWTWGKGNPYASQKSGNIYIHPLDVSKIRGQYPKEASLMVVQMHDYMVQSFVQNLRESNTANKTNWKLTTNPSAADVCVRTAIVKFRPQKPAAKVAAGVMSMVSSMPGVTKVCSIIADGNITIEGTIRDARSGQLLLAFKDSNRKKVRLYTKEAYEKTGNADANLREWAENLGKVIRFAGYDKLGNSTLKQKAEERSYFNVFSQAVDNQL